METRARERTSGFTSDEAPTRPHTVPMLQPRKVVLRRITPAPMRASAPPLPRKKPSVRDAETIPAPPPEAEPESVKPEVPKPAEPPAPPVKTEMPTPFFPIAVPLPPVPATLPPCETGPSSSPDLLPLPKEPELAMTPRRPTRWRWLPRIAVLVVLVGAELAFAERTGAVDIQHARTMLAPVIGSR